MTTIRTLLILCIALLCTACGFHLRGSYPIAPNLQNVYVSYAQPYDPLIIKMNHALQDANVKLAPTADQASYILKINQITETPALQSTSTTNQISTYALQYTINFSLTDATFKVIIAPQNLTSTALYTISSTQLLTNFAQQPTLLNGLQQDVLFQLMNRLSSNDTKRALS